MKVPWFCLAVVGKDDFFERLQATLHVRQIERVLIEHFSERAKLRRFDVIVV